MIKKISQLNRLPEAYYKNLSESERSKIEQSLIEISYQTADLTKRASADETDYYTSYSMELSALSNILQLDEMVSAINFILSGGLTVISGNLDIGLNNSSAQDYVDTYGCDSDQNKKTTIYSKTSLNNSVEVHGETEFHNKVHLKTTNKTNQSLIVDGTVLLNSTASNSNNPALKVVGDAYFDKLIHGTAYRAQWGDLAECYSADAKYEPGTLVMFGGSKEITIATNKVNAVVTTNPAMTMNGKEGESMEYPTEIALVGRVPIKVVGPVKKFDNIVLWLDSPGIGIANNYAKENIIGKALEENIEEGEKLVMCATNFNIM